MTMMMRKMKIESRLVNLSTRVCQFTSQTHASISPDFLFLSVFLYLFYIAHLVDLWQPESGCFLSLISSCLCYEISNLSSDLQWKSKGERHFAIQRAFGYRETVAENWVQLHELIVSKCLIQAQTDPLRILSVATYKRQMKCTSASWVEFNDVSSHW